MFTHDRLTRLIIGATVLTFIVFGAAVSAWFNLIPALIAVNLMVYGLTGKCPVKDWFDQIGVPYEQPPQHLVHHPRDAK